MEIDLGNGSVALIDDCDFDAVHKVELARGLFWQDSIASIGWRTKRRNHTSYAVATLAKQIELRLHRVVMDAKNGDVIDHINGNGLDCRRENLRFVTNAQNNYNRRKSSGSSSKYKGVCRFNGKYVAHIRCDGKKIHLGTFEDEETAASAYNDAAIRLFGEFASLNQVLSGV